jgi:transcriptional regulator with XRE-family HTH domain
MIFIYQVLKQIRISKSYHANAIAKRLGLTEVQLRVYENSFKLIDASLLTRWLDELDIVSVDHAWYIQKHKREYAYMAITDNLIYQISHPQSKDLIAKLADILVFSDAINIPMLCTQLQKHTLPHILPRPRSADIAMDDIKDSDK